MSPVGRVGVVGVPVTLPAATCNLGSMPESKLESKIHALRTMITWGLAALGLLAALRLFGRRAARAGRRIRESLRPLQPAGCLPSELRPSSRKDGWLHTITSVIMTS